MADVTNIANAKRLIDVGRTSRVARALRAPVTRLCTLSRASGCRRVPSPALRVPAPLDPCAVVVNCTREPGCADHADSLHVLPSDTQSPQIVGRHRRFAKNGRRWRSARGLVGRMRRAGAIARRSRGGGGRAGKGDAKRRAVGSADRAALVRVRLGRDRSVRSRR